MSLQQPRAVLEVGPGGGFYSRLICEHSAVKSYIAVDIGDAFLTYLHSKTAKLRKEGEFKAEFICGDISEMGGFHRQFDLVVFYSSLHHIPDRLKVFQLLRRSVAVNGKILVYEPSHYLPRIFDLIKKFIFSGYLSNKFFMTRSNLSTHHFCTYGEFKSICNNIDGLKITHVEYICGRELHKKWFSKLLPFRFISSEIGIVISRE
jgi:SAM-dependent methyltransferase